MYLLVQYVYIIESQVFCYLWINAASLRRLVCVCVYRRQTRNRLNPKLSFHNHINMWSHCDGKSCYCRLEVPNSDDD